MVDRKKVLEINFSLFVYILSYDSEETYTFLDDAFFIFLWLIWLMKILNLENYIFLIV